MLCKPAGEYFSPKTAIPICIFRENGLFFTEFRKAGNNMSEKERIRITLKPKGGKIKISLPSSASPAVPEAASPSGSSASPAVSSPSPVPQASPPGPAAGKASDGDGADVPRKLPSLSLRRETASPAVSEAASPSGSSASPAVSSPSPVPQASPPGGKTKEQIREDEAELEALQKIRQIEAMAQAENRSLLERCGLNRRRLFCLLFFIIVFVFLLFYALTMERGAKVVAEVKNPKGKFGKILPQNNELFNELLGETPQAGQKQDPPGQNAKEEKKDPAPPKPPEPPPKSPEELAAEKLRELVRKNSPAKEIAAQIRDFQNGFLQNEPFHRQTVEYLLGTSYHAVCRSEYLRWADADRESWLPNLIAGMYLLRGRNSIPYLERAIAAAPNRKQPYGKLIGEYYNLGQFSRAAAVCSNCLRIFPDDPDLRVRRARIRFDSGEPAAEILADLNEEIARNCPALTGTRRMVKILPFLLHAGLHAEARKMLDAVGRDPALRSEWALYEIVYALNGNREAPPAALEAADGNTASLKVLYYVSRKDFDSAMHVSAGKEASVYPGFWDTFGAWYCRNDGWKVNRVRLEEKFAADPFRGTMLRLWLGLIPLAGAREIMQHVPPHEKGVMAFLLSLAADREGNPIAKRVLELTSEKSLHVGIYSTLFRHYITR